MPFTFQKLELPEVQLITPKVFSDARGFFKETYKRSEFVANGIDEKFVQDNYSRSSQHVLRGLHFQRPPAAQGKLVGVVKGKIIDVVVDLRESSPNFCKWLSVEISEDNHQLIYVPPGFGHGFMALSESADIQYKVTNEFDATLDGGVRWDDPDIGVQWPVTNPKVSEKDEQLPFLKELGHLF